MANSDFFRTPAATILGVGLPLLGINQAFGSEGVLAALKLGGFLYPVVTTGEHTAKKAAVLAAASGLMPGIVHALNMKNARAGNGSNNLESAIEMTVGSAAAGYLAGIAGRNRSERLTAVVAATTIVASSFLLNYDPNHNPMGIIPWIGPFAGETLLFGIFGSLDS